MKDLDDLHFPDNLKYHLEHGWTSGNSPYRVGISDYAQDQMGNLTYYTAPLKTSIP